MKPFLTLICAFALAAHAQPTAAPSGAPTPPARDLSADDLLTQHQQGCADIASAQDELSADAQQLIIEETVSNVIKLLSEVEDLMDESTTRLTDSDSGGQTLAAQTEIIEKIHAAAKERESSSSSGSSSSAMLEMMERMMGKKPSEESKQGDKPGDQAGTGAGGDSNAPAEANSAAGVGQVETRRIPKASGTAGLSIPPEFQKAFDAYNRGAEKLAK